MVTMVGIDQMMKEAEQEQERAAEELESAESFPITGVQLNDASRLVTIYQRQTGEPRTLPKLAAEIALRKRYRDPHSPLFKQFIFSAKPTKAYHWGETKCLLHPDNPGRAQFDKWGLPVCESAHLASPGEVRRHMELRHPSANKIIKEEERGQQHREELETQRALGNSVLEAIKVLAETRDGSTLEAIKVLAETRDGSTLEAIKAMAATSEAPPYVSDHPRKPRKARTSRK